jgi:lysine 6-dehydrogenase
MSVKKYLVFGMGKMGKAIAYDLLQSDTRCHVTLADANPLSVLEAVYALPQERVTSMLFNGDNESVAEIAERMRGHNVAIGAARYDLLPKLTEAAIASGTHFCDLGGHAGVVEQQFAMQDQAKAAGVRILPDCGVAPGSVSVLAKLAIDSVPDVERVLIRVGGLPQKPTGPLKYAHVFSINGLLGNYLEPTEILRDGKREKTASLRGCEYQYFPELGQLEAAYTADGSSTLTKTYEGRVKDLDYKTLRYIGHWDVVRTMQALGMFDDSIKLKSGGAECTPRQFTEQLLLATLPVGVPDLLVMRVAALNHDRKGVVLDLVDKMDPVTGHSAMQRTTGYSASICAQMLASGEIAETGVLRHEDVVPPLRFVEEWRKRGINLTQYDKVP